MMLQTTVPTQRPLRNEVIHVLPGFILTVLMLWCVVRSIAVANWASGLDVLIPVALPALVLGTIFARLRWLPAWLAHLLSGVLGFVWTVQALGPLMGERLITWRDQATELVIRTIILIRILASGGRGEDILLFIASLSLLAWILGYATAWMIFRGSWLWRPVLINAVVILVNYTYVYPKPTSLFFIFLTAALLLLVYQNIASRQEQWNATQIEYPEFLPLRFVAMAAVCCGTLVLITSLLPNRISNEQVARAWKTMSAPFTMARERWEDAFSTINAPPGISTGGSFTSRTSMLGGARALGDEVVMYVRAPRFDYWRAVASDRYDDGGWHNTTGEQARAALGAATAELARTPRDTGAPIPHDDTRGRTVVIQQFEMAKDRKDDLIMVGGQAASISLPTLVEHNYAVGSQNQLRPLFDDTSLIVSQEPLRAGMVYSVTALVSNADIQSLRLAGTNYPTWITDRYLQLPDNITQRTRDLARDIVTQAAAGTPYDQAVAIQNYLRTLTYNENIDAPPPGAEPVDYFLFDLQEGYCDYYASSMVVMLRSLGIPARWAKGYAGGILDPESGAFVVRENVAHSWPEVYFPGFGWERFEPTPASYTAIPNRPEAPPNYADESQTPDAYPFGNTPDSRFEEELEPGLEAEDPTGAGAAQALRTDWGALRQQLAIAGIVLGLLGLAGYALLLRWRYELRGLSPAAAAYAQIGIWASLAGIPQHAHATPYEYGVELIRVLPQHRREIARVIEAYIAERYRGATPGTQNFATELREIRRSLIEYGIIRLGSALRLPARRPATRGK